MLKSVGNVVIAGMVTSGTRALAVSAGNAIKPTVRFGALTDVHYADIKTKGSRVYRDSLAKMSASVNALNREQVDFVVMLGDFIDTGDNSVENELRYLQDIEKEYAKLTMPRHYVFGNHCLQILTKKEFIAETAMETPYGSFDRGGWHFVRLDSCYTSKGEPYQRNNFDWRDANIPESEVEWLRNDLEATILPTIVFVHQRLDPDKNHSIGNDAEIRTILEKSGKVAAVFQGHSHLNHAVEINGITYCVIRATVDGAGLEHNSCGIVEAFADGSIRVKGLVKQDSYEWST
jgi:alkaline phosphatase